jgi:hypothetical protein
MLYVQKLKKLFENEALQAAIAQPQDAPNTASSEKSGADTPSGSATINNSTDEETKEAEPKRASGDDK